jgi:hypothetical protein
MARIAGRHETLGLESVGNAENSAWEFYPASAIWFGSRPPPDAALRQAIDRAVEAVDPRLKAVSDYQRRLALAVAQALRHCAEVAAAIPGPVEIGPGAFATDPLVHALFAAPGDIADMLGKSREVREFLCRPRQCHAAG